MPDESDDGCLSTIVYIVYQRLELTVTGSWGAPARAGSKNRPSKNNRMYAKKAAIATLCVLCGPISKYMGFGVF